MPNKLEQSIRTIFAQFGGGTPPTSPFNPGGPNFVQQGGRPGNQINRYYETPLDANVRRINDPSLSDDTLGFEKRLEIYHGDIENDLRSTTLRDTEKAQLQKSDKALRNSRILSGLPKKDKTPPHDPKYVAFEVLLEAARQNTNEKHPFEDVNPPVIKPSRRHTVSQIYLNRGTGTSPFLGYTSEEERSPFDKARYSTPPDGNPRSYPYRNQSEIDEYLQNPKDIDFMSLYGETLPFDHPQDAEEPNANYNEVYEILKNLLHSDNTSQPQEDQLEKWRKQLVETLKRGPGKARRMDQYFGDTRDQFQETMGTADKYPATPEGSVGMQYWGFSSA